MVFKHKRTAENAVRALLDAGVSADRVSVFVRPTPRHLLTNAELKSAADFGGIVGAGLGVIAGVGFFLVPGLGPVLGTGALASGLTGAVLGACAGGAAGSLAGASLSEVDAARAEHHLREGKTVVMVEDQGEHEKLAAIARSQGSVEVVGV